MIRFGIWDFRFVICDLEFRVWNLELSVGKNAETNFKVITAHNSIKR